MAEDDGILFVVAALIAGACLWFYLRFRHRRPDHPLERQWPGRGIDTSLISNRVRRVRRDYVAELQSRPLHPERTAAWRALFRAAVAALPYFRGRRSHTTSRSGESDRLVPS